MGNSTCNFSPTPPHSFNGDEIKLSKYSYDELQKLGITIPNLETLSLKNEYLSLRFVLCRTTLLCRDSPSNCYSTLIKNKEFYKAIEEKEYLSHIKLMKQNEGCFYDWDQRVALTNAMIGGNGVFTIHELIYLNGVFVEEYYPPILNIEEMILYSESDKFISAFELEFLSEAGMIRARVVNYPFTSEIPRL